MADAKISDLTSAIPAMQDLLPFVDVSDTSMAGTGSTRKMTVSDMLAADAGLEFVLNRRMYMP